MLTSCCSLIATLTKLSDFQKLQHFQKLMDTPSVKTMLFPDDLRQLLHEFAGPKFKYFKEFNAYKRMIWFDCAALRTKLNGENPEPTAEILRAYLEAEENLRQANAAYSDHMARSRADLTVSELIQYRVDQERLWEETSYGSWVCVCTHQELRADIYGEDPGEYPSYGNSLYEEDEEDYSLRRWAWTEGGWVATTVGWN